MQNVIFLIYHLIVLLLGV